MKNIKILDQLSTIKRIKEGRLSVARFGDGEVRWMLYPNFSGGFQRNNSELSKRLKEVFTQTGEHLMVCLSRNYANNVNISEYWKKIVLSTKYDVVCAVNRDVILGDTDITRNAKNVPSMKEIWQNKNVVKNNCKSTHFLRYGKIKMLSLLKVN